MFGVWPIVESDTNRQLPLKINVNTNCNQLFRQQSEFGQTSKQHAIDTFRKLTIHFERVLPFLSINVAYFSIDTENESSRPNSIKMCLRVSAGFIFIELLFHHQ